MLRKDYYGFYNLRGLTNLKEIYMCAFYFEKNLICSMSVHYIIQNTNHQQMHKESFIINRSTLLHVSTLLSHLQEELFCYRYTNVALYR
jgi:hypothetical protein